MAALRLFTILVVLNSSLHAQTNIVFILKNAAAHRIDTVEAFDLTQKEVYNYDFRDTLTMHFKKNNIDCYNILCHGNGQIYRRQIWLDSGNIRIEAHIDSSELLVDTVVNSPTYYQAKNFAREYRDLWNANDTIALNNYLLTKYEENIQNPFSFVIGNLYIQVNQNLKTNLIEFKSYTDRQGDRFSWFYMYPLVIDRLNKILEVEKVNLNNFTFISIENRKTILKLQGSDYYVLDFWFLSCVPCILDHKKIKLDYEKLKQKGVELVSISIDDDFSPWKNYLASHNYTWRNYLQMSDNTLSNSLGIHGCPTYVILNNKGEIIETYTSFSNVEKKFNIGE
jgi:hypothetical protein